MRKILISSCCLLLLSPFAYAGVCRDDFEDGNANGWKEVSGTWEVRDGVYVQLEADGDVPRTVIQSPWEFTDGNIEVTITFDKKSDGNEIPAILYRMVDDDNGYAFRLHNDRLEVGKLANGQYSNIRGDAFPIAIKKPCQIKLEVEGVFTKVYYDGVIKMRIGDPEPKRGFDQGKIGLAVFDANKPIYFDNVTIEGEKIFPFFSFGKKVAPCQKLTSVWGRIKTQ